ncbi:LytTR family DNA-binding domain-containing protein [Oscillospiraceae bacterium OttesenSCG-928-F05]|nr:LytTR family DNA-binding domain-containing protein [Oscillospiraceae bacterium OttesenSCG-928-F05]
MRIAICDDEKRILDDLGGMLAALLQRGDTLECYSSPMQLMDAVAREPTPIDVIFLDIEFPCENGVDIGRELKRIYGSLIHIIYFTKHPDFAVDAYRQRAFHYLVKPVSPEELAFALSEARDSAEALRADDEVMTFPCKRGKRYVRLGDIVYMESSLHTLTVHLRRETFTLRGRLREYEERLSSKGFYRIHKSYLVNLTYVQLEQRRSVRMGDTTVLPIGNDRDLNAFLLARSHWLRRRFNG